MIICADMHLGKVSDSITLDNGMKSQIQDVVIRLHEAQSIAKEREETIVILGDIFNKVNPPTEVISVFFAWLGQAGVPVVILPGNHDCGVNWANLGMLRGLNLPDVTIVTRPSMVNIEDREVLCVPHIPLREQEQIVEEHDELGGYFSTLFGDQELIIGHGMPAGLDYSNDIFFEAGDALSIDVRTFPKFKLMILGHVHKHLSFKYRSREVVTPGSATIINFGEVSDEKGYLQVDVPSLLWHFVPYESEVTPYRDITIDLVSKDTVDLSDSVIRNVSTGAVIKLRVMARDRIQVDEIALRKVFNQYGYVSRFETIIQASGASEDDSVDESIIYSDVSPVNMLRKRIMACDASEEIKKLAISMGKEIIEEVLDVG